MSTFTWKELEKWAKDRITGGHTTDGRVDPQKCRELSETCWQGQLCLKAEQAAAHFAELAQNTPRTSAG